MSLPIFFSTIPLNAWTDMLHVDLSCAKVSISIMGALECCGRGLGVIVLATIAMYAMLHAGGGRLGKVHLRIHM